MAAKKFIPSLHPRDRFGRFTRSRSAKATLAERSQAEQISGGLKPKKGITGAKSAAYLDSFAPGKSRAAVSAYADGGYVDTHKALRAGKADDPSVKAMDAAMVELPDDVALSRRVPNAVFGPAGPEALVGMRVRDAAYAPTSIGAVRATKGDVRMRISAPAGTRAAVHPETGEVILDRDLDMVVTKVEKNAAGGWDMHVAVLPKTNAGGSAVVPAKSAPAAKPAKALAKKAAPLKDAVPAKSTPAEATPAKPDDTDDGPDTSLSAEDFRAQLMKNKVVELKAMMKERGLKPGKLRKAELVNALTADEYGTEKDTPGTPKAPASPETPAEPETAKPEPAAQPTGAAQVEAGDFSALKRIGPQAGSNPGGLFEAADGSRWYVKAQRSPEHAQNEALASALYRAAGIDTPEVVRGKGAPGVSGQWMTASRIVDGAKADVKGRIEDDAYLAQIRQGFAVDAWLANWDVAGMTLDNIVTGGDGKPHRIDLGGSLLYRAKGEPKGAGLGPDVGEWTSLRSPDLAPQAAKIFGGMTRAQMVAAVERVEKVSDADIDRLTAEAGLPDLGGVLKQRRRQLVGMLPQLREERRRARRWNSEAGAALLGREALKAAPLRLLKSKLDPAPEGWSKAREQAAAKALDDYQGDLYQAINGQLRGEANGENVIESIVALDDALDASAVPQAFLVFRGIKSPSSVFGAAWNNVDVVGMEWVDDAYASTTVDRRVAEAFAPTWNQPPEPPVIMRIVQPAGSSAIRLSDMAPQEVQPYGIKFEAELLLARGQKRRVVADHGVDADGRRILDVEVIPA